MRAVAVEMRIVRATLKQIPPTETARVPEEMTGRQRRIPVGKITLRQTFRALRHRNYRLFFYGQLVSLIGTWMQSTAMSWLVYQITGSKLLLGVVAAVTSAPMMFLSLWGGAVADRLSETHDHRLGAGSADGAGVRPRGPGMERSGNTVDHHRALDADRRCDGVRHAGTAGVHH